MFNVLYYDVHSRILSAVTINMMIMMFNCNFSTSVVIFSLLWCALKVLFITCFLFSVQCHVTAWHMDTYCVCLYFLTQLSVQVGRLVFLTHSV